MYPYYNNVMGVGKGALIPRLQGVGRLFDILAWGVDGYQSVGAYSRKYRNVISKLKITQKTHEQVKIVRTK